MTKAPVPIDSGWIAANPLPSLDPQSTTKNNRGRVLAIGGSRKVPGALRLTGEAALRAGAGKLQLATIAAATTGLGLLIPEAAVIALDESDDGELAGVSTPLLEASSSACDTLVVGPGISTAQAAEAVLRMVLDTPCDEMTLIVDAMPIGCLKTLRAEAKALAGRLIVTPNHDEMATLTGGDAREIAADPERFARAVADDYLAVVVLKGSETVIAAPDGLALGYEGGGVGLATGGSGDVLAGAIAGLSSRGAAPEIAAAWGVWLHGQSGRLAAVKAGPIGFLARELPREFPPLLAR